MSPTLAVENLEHAGQIRLLSILKHETLDVRARAEIAFALMQFYHNNHDDVAALSFGELSIALFERCDIKDEVSSVPRYPVIADVQMPDRIHEGVVRARLLSWRLLPRE